VAINVDLQIASQIKALPTLSQITAWVEATLAEHPVVATELTIRLVDEAESAYLNAKYRKKSGATNVLSFPAEIAPQFAWQLLGDIIICAPIVVAEATTHQIDLFAHWAHLVIHGTLHLLGYNHINDSEAIIMEKLETKILAQFGYSSPYGRLA
jgi:probable rRNA maturation factor